MLPLGLPSSPWQLASLLCSVSTSSMFVTNLFFYREPKPVAIESPSLKVSVLIPARNEESGITAAVASVLASVQVDLELLVMDDGSTDDTAARVQAVAARDARVILHTASPLPEGWNGKQHACYALAQHASHDVLCFLDADVRLKPEALVRLLGELNRQRVDLISGFPREETGTWLERLLIPLIHFVLLAYLPMPGVKRQPRNPGFAAGCGQLMVVRREAYIAAGGHAAIRQTMHDGILLPKLFRNAGRATGLVDLTNLARCRMYRNAAEVWRGLEKNATEGLAAPARIVPFTLLLMFGQVAPAIWLMSAFIRHGRIEWAFVAVLASYLPRVLAVIRFRQSILGAFFHPVGVSVLLVLQWWSLARKLLGRQTQWKQRAYDLG